MHIHSHCCRIPSRLGVRLGMLGVGGTSSQERLPVEAGPCPLQWQGPGTYRVPCLGSVRGHPFPTAPGLQIGQEQADVQAHTRSTGVCVDPF
jgi:hypothetical protein